MNQWIIAAAAGGAACLMRSEYEKKHLETVYYEVQTEKLGPAWDGLKAVFLSDFHDNSFGRDNDSLLEAIEREHPDLILIGGDMLIVKEWKKQDFSALERLLSRLSRLCPVYYALGNHEQRMKEKKEKYPGWWDEYIKMLKRCQVNLLINRRVVLDRAGEALCLSGVTLGRNCYAKGRIAPVGAGYIEQKVGKAANDSFELLLAHSPLFLDAYAGWGADLVLSGHFHGGTIRIPGLGGVMTPQLHFFSPLTRGRIRKNQTDMIVSGGLGTHSVNVRLNNLPQLVVLTWKSRKTVYSAGKL